MPIENAKYVNEFEELYPLGTDGIRYGDDHFRKIKAALVRLVLPNIAALRTLPTPVSSVCCFVLEHTTEGDMGGGWFQYESARASDDDNGLCVLGWTRQLFGQPITPEMFGATASGDQTAVMEQMRDAVEALGGGDVAFYPLRTYTINGVLTFNTGNLRIDGNFARLHSTNTTRTDVLQVFGDADNDRAEHVYIKRLVVSGVYWPSATPTGNGIALKWVNGGNIEKCFGRNCSDGAVSVTDCDHFEIIDCLAQDCAQPLNVFNHCKHCRIINNHVVNATVFNAINVEGFANGSIYQPDDITVEGNLVDSAEWIGVNMENTLRGVVRENRISNCARADGFGVQLYGSPNVRCLNNTMTDGAGYGLRIGPNCTEAVIDGNTTSGNALGSVQHDDGPAVATCYNVALGPTNVWKEGYPTQSGNVSFAGWLVPNNPDTDPRHLDNYIQGTFTPVVYGTTSAGVGTYTVQAGRYTRSGDTVKILIQLAWSAHTGSGNLEIGGLPFTVGSLDCPLALTNNGLALSAGNVAQALAKTATGVVIVNQYSPATGAASAIPLDTSVAGIGISGEYFV